MILKKIRKLCVDKGISIYQLEREVKLSHASIAKWEKSSPSVANLQKVADYFGVSISDLLEDNKVEEVL